MTRRRLVDLAREQDRRNGQARPSDPQDPGPPALIGDEPHAPDEELGILLSTVQPERVEWLWPGRIPLGKLTIIDGGRFSSTLSQNCRFSTKKSGQFRGLTKDALLQSHVNRVTFSLTSTLPMANSGCLCPVIVAGWRAGRLAL